MDSDRAYRWRLRAFGELDRDKEISELISFPLHVAKSQLPYFAVSRLSDERDLACIDCMAIAHISGNVVSRRDIPAERSVELLVGRRSFHDSDRNFC